ncbi:hypothetical protein [uncultured Cohaesibacter sp.]|uniref:hypothetical protein n=1 Tax=uncultured Cohaesibacter sp. TaxID=1002546 RepID=UPI00292D2EBA|nr:hypothetical protein [uncultured Cohaesibacter sp.]
MSQLHNMIMWTSATRTGHRRSGAFEDPFERPEWRPFLPLIDMLHSLSKKG